MKWPSIKWIVKAAVFAWIVTLSLVTAKAHAQTCEGLFPRPSVYRESYAPLNELNTAAQKFIREVSDHSIVWKPEVLQERILELERLTEKYLISAGIPFVKTLDYFRLKDKNGDVVHTTGYGIYHLSGSRLGDETARLLEGVFANPEFKDHSLHVLFDPLYGLNHPSSVGHFQPATRFLLIGPNVIAEGTKGIRTTLRHEVQHYLEQIEILQGKMSLGRLSFWSSNPKEQIPYANYIRLDELETHLRDLRGLLNSKMTSAKDQRLSKAVDSEEKMQEIRAERKAMAIDKEAKIQRMINHANMMIHGLKHALERGQYEVTTAPSLNKVEVVIKNLKGPYPEVRVDLTAMVPLEKSTDKKLVESTMKAIFDWTGKRVSEIDMRASQLPKP